MAKKAAKKPAKKAVPAKKVAKQPAKKPAKKPAKQPAKKAAKKAAKKPAKKAVPAKKVAKKPVKKPVKKAAKKVAKQPVKKPAKKVVKKAVPAKQVAPAPAPEPDVAPKSRIKPIPKSQMIRPKPKKRPRVREDESPWTRAELRAVEDTLHEEVRRLEEEIETAELGLADLIRDSGDGAGDDQADAGSKTFEREHEMSLARNARDMLDQAHHALARIADGSYGICESCANPIGKYRLQAFPRATLCVVCKEAEERFGST